jgi:hypothetical protein
MAVPGQFRIYWKNVKVLNGCLTVSENIGGPTCVALFYILHYASRNGIYFGLVYSDVEPKAEAVPPSCSLSIHPTTSTLMALDLPMYQTCIPLLPWLNPVLKMEMAYLSELLVLPYQTA